MRIFQQVPETCTQVHAKRDGEVSWQKSLIRASSDIGQNTRP